MNCLLCRFVHDALSRETAKCTVTIVTKVRFMPLPQCFLGQLSDPPVHPRSLRAMNAAPKFVCASGHAPLERWANGTREKSMREARGLKADSCDFDHSTWAGAPVVS